MQYTYILLLGGNLGNVTQTFEEAISLIKKKGELNSKTSLYKTAPWGFDEHVPAFYNQALEISINYEPLELLDFLQGIEKTLGREAKTQNGKYTSRTIDIDIIFCGSIVMNTPRLTIPHPQIQNRRFVLEPLNEKWPHFVHPVLKQNIATILSNCADCSEVTITD
ncbi:MAG: 2-amino-4-hydroxy-6-hydroxymethyldihydropteridine diphosphokinase [Bacteroidales bacterium]|nr:2-amino-4-hydroxy-6-hydroxymethyldihydropteridine diphosphokinase [Bacteroidales bacterium]